MVETFQEYVQKHAGKTLPESYSKYVEETGNTDPKELGAWMSNIDWKPVMPEKAKKIEWKPVTVEKAKKKEEPKLG